MADASLASNNPFRRKQTTQVDADMTDLKSSTAFLEAVDPPSHSSSDSFRRHLDTLPHSSQPPPPTSFQKPKVVKKVRVQSPPPSSPDSLPAGPDDYPPIGRDEDSSDGIESDDDGEAEDPFRTNTPQISLPREEDLGRVPVLSQPPPPNPFQKTLEDMEQSSKGGNQSGTGNTGVKGSLDVEAFRRLLMTGQASTPQSGLTPPGDGASNTDASSISRQSISETTIQQETPRTSHEISEAEVEDDRATLVASPLSKSHPGPSTLKKKPPPPSSRHGKSIKLELQPKENSSDSTTRAPDISSPATSPSKQRPSTPSDVNKPLPPAPAPGTTEEDIESIFDKEAAGKVPDLDTDSDVASILVVARPPTPPNARHAASTPAEPPASRKPAPPPRRSHHGRTDSKSSVINKAVPGPGADEPEGERRSSLDSTRSRSSSLRAHAPAPAPPPPRRPANVSRHSASFVSPSAVSFSGTSPEPSDAEKSPLHAAHSTAADTSAAAGKTLTVSSARVAQPKLSPPPPPPARNVSVRSAAGRPASLEAPGIGPRRSSREKDSGSMGPPPPPPPKRSRGGSRGSTDGVLVRRTSVDSVRVLGGAVAEIVEEPASTSEDTSAANDILADLDALQREVDALRGQYEKPGTGSDGAPAADAKADDGTMS
jgi:hypothetical protein